MRDYEILFILRPELDEEQVAEAVKSVDRLIANLSGVTQHTDIWGKRRLAYEVAHLREGHYVLTDFQLEPERLDEMEATLKISETVFRHLVVRKPEKIASRTKAAPAAASPAAAEAATAEPAEAVATADAQAPAEAEAAASDGHVESPAAAAPAAPEGAEQPESEEQREK